jgi:hypothetical protein
MLLLGYFYLQKSKVHESKENHYYSICNAREIKFHSNALDTTYSEPGFSKKENKGGVEYRYSESGVYKEKNLAVTWTYKLDTKKGIDIPSYKLWTTENFYTYIYKINEQKESAKLERKVDIKKMVQVENPSYQPVSIPDKAEVNGEVCYIVYVANKEAKETNDGYRWFAISFKDDQIKKIFTTRKEYNEQAKILDIDK